MAASDIIVGQMYGPLLQIDDASRPVLVTAVDDGMVVFVRFDAGGHVIVPSQQMTVAAFRAWAG